MKEKSQHSSAAIHIENLSYAYRGNWSWTRRAALAPFSLSIQSGEFFGFLGHNGAGKTTTIKCLLGLVRPASGRVEFFGKDARLPESRQNIGYVPEHPYFYDHLSVEELLEMYAVLAGVPSGTRKQEVDRVLARLKITERRKQPLRVLSKGLVQRVAMAQAILGEPRILILDEPFSGLDPMGRHEFKELLFELKSEGTTVFLSSHILEDVELLCDRVSILSQGKLMTVLDLGDLRDHQSSDWTLRLQNTNTAELIKIVEAADEKHKKENYLDLRFPSEEKARAALREALSAGIRIEAFSRKKQTLEELFLRCIHKDFSGPRT